MTGMPPAFRKLMERYCELGRLLPRFGDDIDIAVAVDDPAEYARLTVILREMDQVKAQINAALDAAKAERRRVPDGWRPCHVGAVLDASPVQREAAHQCQPR